MTKHIYADIQTFAYMNERQELAAYLVQEGYDDAFWHSKFWNISEEAETLLKHAGDAEVSDKIEQQLDIIKDNKSVDAPSAIEQYQDGFNPSLTGAAQNLRHEVFHNMHPMLVTFIFIVAVLFHPVWTIFVLYFGVRWFMWGVGYI